MAFSHSAMLEPFVISLKPEPTAQLIPDPYFKPNPSQNSNLPAGVSLFFKIRNVNFHQLHIKLEEF